MYITKKSGTSFNTDLSINGRTSIVSGNGRISILKGVS
jgi:hypothetical protein